MFSFLFEGKLGELIAPTNQEIDPNSVFQEALYAGKREELLALLEEHYDNKQPEDRVLDIHLPPIATAGNRPIHIAAAKGLRDIVAALADRGADINCLGALKNSCLHYAARHDHVQVIAELIRRGADRDVPNQKGLKPIDQATSLQARGLISGDIEPAEILDLPEEPSTPDSSMLPVGAGVLDASTALVSPMKDLTLDDNGNFHLPLTPGPKIQRSSGFSPPPDNMLKDAVLDAARETAMSNAADLNQFQRRHDIFQLLQSTSNEKTQKRNIKKLRSRLETDPSLARIRAAQHGALAQDGFTPLHAAAAHGNVEAMQVLLEYDISTWARDLQGRTALHIAAEHGHLDSCQILKARMASGSGTANREPVGTGAPIDLAGRTPLGWSAKKRKGRPAKELEETLFRPGDHSVLPVTPFSTRASQKFNEVSGQLIFGFAEAQGYRDDMEDAILHHCPLPAMDLGKGTGLLGIFDGHGGDFTSNFCATNFLSCLLETSEWQTQKKTDPAVLQAALKKSFLLLDSKLSEESIMKVTKENSKFSSADCSGSTGLVVLVTESHLLVASVGDTRAVLCQQGEDERQPVVIQMSEDHKPGLESERSRVEAAGGVVQEVVIEEGGEEGEVKETVFHRVKFSETSNYSLAMTRAFGDFYYKQQTDEEGNIFPPEQQVVSAEPDIRCHARSDKDQFLVLACDGIWDVLSNQEVVGLLSSSLSQSTVDGNLSGDNFAAACDIVLQSAIEKGTTDNLSIIAINLGFGDETAKKQLKFDA